MRAAIINEERLEAFALAYVPALVEAIKVVKPQLAKGVPLEDAAINLAVAMVDAIRRAGVPSIAHYVLNQDALRLTCDALGIENSIDSLTDYIGGR